MHKWSVIVNSHSGGAPEQMAARLLKDRRGEIGSVQRTQFAGHATVLAREASAAEGVIAIGGDGTISEILQGMDLQRQTLAVVSAGRGNSFARDLGLYRTRVNLLGLPTRRLDLMQVTFRTSPGESRALWAASNIAIGYPAAVAGLANRRFRAMGSCCYAAAALFTPLEKRSLTLQYDGRAPQEERLTGLMISNTCHAANFKVFPKARCEDASLETVELHAGWLGQLRHNLSTVTGWTLYHPRSRDQVRKLSISSNHPQPLLVDGELFHDVLSLDIEVRPAALSCLVNW